MEIDYEAIARRLEGSKSVDDKPHPWEQEHPNATPWRLDYREYYSLNRDDLGAVGIWNKRQYARRPIDRFLRKVSGISSLEIYAMVLQGKIQPPHRNECAKCNEIRELRKKSKRSGRL